MNAADAYRYIRKHTNDRIVLKIARSFLDRNKTVRWLKDLFGIEVNQKIQLNIDREYNSRFHKNETVYSFTTGIIFKKTFRIRTA